jgi:hypothetical protein
VRTPLVHCTRCHRVVQGKYHKDDPTHLVRPASHDCIATACQATTMDGWACAASARPGSRVCGHHAAERSWNPPPERRERRGVCWAPLTPAEVMSWTVSDLIQLSLTASALIALEAT